LRGGGGEKQESEGEFHGKDKPTTEAENRGIW
jgi:hypothetical protein